MYMKWSNATGGVCGERASDVRGTTDVKTYHVGVGAVYTDRHNDVVLSHKAI